MQLEISNLGLPSAFWDQQALHFNTQPAGYLHPSWCERLPHGELISHLRMLPRAHAELSRHLLMTFQLEGCYVEDFAHPWARLALLDGYWITHLLYRLGLVLLAPSLRVELSGERLRAFKSALSAEDWHFVTREAPLFGPIPNCQNLQKLSYPIEIINPATLFAQIGLRFCANHGLGALDKALTQRLALKLPADWASILHTNQTSDTSVLPLILRKLLRELPSTWIPLFA